MLPVDFHVHSLKSGHACHTLDELLQIAHHTGMRGFALTDHCPGMDNRYWLYTHPTNEEIWEHVIDAPDINYFRVFLSRFRPENCDVRLFKGIECNILNNGKRPTDIPLDIASRFDIIICSVHPLKHLFKREPPEKLTETVLKALDEPMDILGHPYHKNIIYNYEPVVKKAAKKGIAIELNNSSLETGKASTEDVCNMLQLVKSYDGCISLGSDAHCSNELGADNNIWQILDQTGFPLDRIVNQSLESAEEFVKRRKWVREQFWG